MSDVGNPLRPHNRMQNSDEFDSVFKMPDAKVHHRYFLALGKVKSVEHAKVGLVVGKKNIPKAVQRNRFKRIARESYRQQKKALCDVVILAKKVAPEVSNEELRSAFDTALMTLNRKVGE